MTSRFLSAKKASSIIDAFFVLFYLIFVYSHITAFFTYHIWTLLIFALSESIIIVLFLTRTKSVSVSEEPFDYFVAIAGTLAALLFRPFIGEYSALGNTLVIIGASMQIISLFSLNSSFGIVSALRKVKSNGL
jgi:hypothetical protein